MPLIECHSVSHSTTLQEHIDRCVMCGLCSQHCPTYNLTQDESESPRGRIALVSAASKGQLSLQGKASLHLEHCVSCRACEAFCPSGVQFGAIMDEGREMMAAQTNTGHPSPLLRQVLDTVTRPARLARLTRWTGRYQRWGLQAVARQTGILKLLGLAEAEQLLPDLPSSLGPLPAYTPAVGESRGDVALFTGCITRMVDHETLEASRRLLSRLGFGVHIPAAQTCCGALHRHNGEADTGRELANTNQAVFGALNVQAILHTATGCTAQLKEYGEWLGQSGSAEFSAPLFATKVQDINQFLVGLMDAGQWPAELTIKPLPQTVLVHESCSLKNVLKQADKPSRLLGLIPELTIKRLPADLGCCGAAGSYMLTQADFAKALRENTLKAITDLAGQTPARWLATANIGCALHLGAGLREQGIDLAVIHPVSLLYRQISGE